MKALLRSPLLWGIVALAGLAGYISLQGVEAEPIVFGSDQCHFCKMGIVDTEHAAQFVTRKGKQFKFDAVECMVNELEAHPRHEPALLLVSDYGHSRMIDAVTATYLFSPGIRSPMGANLSGFSSTPRAQEAQRAHGGVTASWHDLPRMLEKAR